MKINRPTSISICFVGGDLKLTKSQQDMLQEISNKYIVEFLHRGDKYSKNYNSFSQVINEFVVEAKNEFLVFINPKVESISSEKIEDLIDKLCSGFCWVSRISFGFWATTKELFRNIGMMDERFIGGEYEDIDFIMRLKFFNRAIFWEYQYDEYPWNTRFNFSGMRGLSRDVFSNKWYDDGDSIYLNKGFEEKRLPMSIRLNRNYEIFNSWMNSDKTEIINRYDMPGISEYYKRNLKYRNLDQVIKYASSNLTLLSDGKSYKIEFLCNEKTHITVVMINSNDQRLCTSPKSIYSNTWCADDFYEDTDDYIEIKIFHCCDKIYHNKFTKRPINLNFDIGLKINSYSD